VKYDPHPYQKRAIKFMIERACAALFLDPGLGKTSITLAAFQLLKREGMVESALVIAPLRPARSVWPGESKKWDDFAELSVNVLHGPDKTDRFVARSDIDVINPEGLPWLFGLLRKMRVREWPWQMLIIDESTRFKHTQTQRFKQLKPHLLRFRRRYILTGSPAPNGLLDLFGQVYILDVGNSLGRFITKYRFDFFDSTGYGGFKFKIKDGAEKRIYKKLAPLVLRMDAKDHLKLPPLVNNRVEVELPPKAQKIYDAMDKLLIAAVEDETVTAVNIAAASIKCRQIANGGIYKDEGSWAHIHEAKVEATAEIVEELSGKPALIAYEFKHDLERLKREFGKDTPHLGGGVTGKRQAEIEEAWNAGELPILLAQPQSVAHGLNLQGVGAAVIWHSLTWDLENYEQLVRRIWRQGQKERVVVHHLVAKDTVDEAIMAALASKDRTQRALLSALKAYALRRRKRPIKVARTPG
jgi:SNF2 family DNA or RNA helicase